MTATLDARSDGPNELIGRSLPAILLARAASTPDDVALRKKALGRWRTYTWREYASRASSIGRGLAELGIEEGDRVAVHSENRVAWLLADMGIQGIGGVTVGVYPTSPAAEVEYLLGHSEARVVIVEDQEQLDKTLAVRSRLPELEKIVLLDDTGLRGFTDPMVITLAELEALGSRRPEEEFARRVAEIDESRVAAIVYTSGTTGPPKGAMLTHRSLLAAASATASAFGMKAGDEVVSYLPLCHVAERLISLVNAIALGYVVNFPESPNTVAQDLAEIQPTFFLGVPRVWEKYLASVEIRMEDASALKRANYRFWMRRGRAMATKRLAGGSPGGIVYLLGWLLLYRTIRRKLGLGRVREAVSGAAPIAPQVLEWFWAIGVPVREGYGQTEGTGLGTLNPRDEVRIGTVGKPMTGLEVRIADDGEILLRSPAVFAGYFKDDEATAVTVDGDGWLHTGDVGMLDRDSYLTITDRKRDIIITAGGKNVSPTEIENKLKVSPHIKEAVVLGDRRRYLTALIGIELDTVGNWASKNGVPFTTYADLSSKQEVVALVQAVVDSVNEELAQVETIKRFALLTKELDHEEGELTATQKVKRAAIAMEFADLIEGMYQ
ncbi:MAG TPA: AMP-binding protein [Acidimicrobiales bacterium]|nr:AMP-binding protein [Acidimicrobiales bacterium]